MNERIKELVIETLGAQRCRVKHREGAEGVWVGHWAMSDERMVKFAELIVRECIEIAYDYDSPKMSGPGMIIAGRIESRFGVEE